MNNLWRRIGIRKSRSKPASDHNVTDNKTQESEPARNKLVLLGNPAERFNLDDLLRASAQILGRDTTFGNTYKADLGDFTTVVVKRLKPVVLSAEDFQDKVKALGAMDHENLLPLRGYFYSKDEILLLYDYMPLGSLLGQLHPRRDGGGSPLSWQVRLSIALGAARAIEYLHAQSRPYVHHGNIKSSNVLLTPSYEARVSDFGLNPLRSPSPFPRPTTVTGADPRMADVYGFGVLLLELLTGKLHTHPRQMEEGVDLPAWVLSIALEELNVEIFDVELRTYDDIEGMVELLKLAISCVSPNLGKRPRMSEVRRKIEEQCSPARNEMVLLGNPPKKFDIEDVLRANKQELAKGTFGTTYRADLEDGTTTVILKMLKSVVLSAEDFRDKVEAISAMDHENLLPLRGYFYSKDMKFLLYDYMPLGSLSDRLHPYSRWKGTPLSWEVRLSIGLGAAQAIEHLHAQGIQHGNINSYKILLMPSCKVRVSGYGLTLFTTPVSAEGEAKLRMADVYGFGELLLDLLMGKPRTQTLLKEQGQGLDLPRWVQDVLRDERFADVFDVELMRYQHIEGGMVKLLEMAISCVSPNLYERPRLSEVRRKIEQLCSPGVQRDGDSQPDKVRKGNKDRSSLIQLDRDLQLNQFSQVNNNTYPRKTTDGVLEVSERVYGLDQMDVPCGRQSQYSTDFRAEISFSERNPAASPVSVDSSGDEERKEIQFLEGAKKIEAQEPQFEDQAVYSALLSQDASASHDENEGPELPIQSDTAFPTPTLITMLSYQLEASVHSALDGSHASSDSASSSLSQDGSPGSFSATHTKKTIKPLKSPKQQLVSSLELSQDVHSAVTETNFEITSGGECISSSAGSGDSVQATKELVHNSAKILEMTMPREEKSRQLDGFTSSTSKSSGFDYDVFLSFRGPDTRSGITDFLYTSLLAAGIHTYRDDDELRIGEKIGPELLKAINHSKVSIPIFSKGYAFSKWCLNELVQMVECRKSRRQKIMPIFYDVAPIEVRHQTGSYGDAFVSHEKQFDNEVISKWKAALKEVGDLKGWDIDAMATRREGELVSHIVQKVIAELKKAYLLVTDCLVGIEHHVKEINRMVCDGSEDIQILGIHGMGGVGKTTLAKIIYNNLSHRFEDCCFISNVRETSQLKGIECLQNQLLSDILKRNWSNISNVDDGIKTIKERLCGKKVLVLLDDVDKRIHLNALIGRPVWFGLGSRIIITSRNTDVFNVPEVCFTYELTGMDFNQSLQLFCKHAFGRDHPLDEYADFSNEVVKMTGGLPLALEVIGSLLWGKSKDVWDVTMKKLEKVPHEQVKRKLKICYDALDDRQKQIFLDIACLFIGFDKRIVLHMWNDSNLFPGEGLQVLQQMSLIKIEEDNKLRMHDQLRDLGRDIARHECSMEPEKQTRLWNHEEALDIVMRKKGTDKVEALCLKFDHRLQQSFPIEELRRLSNLRYLEMRPVLDNWRPSGFSATVLPMNPPILAELRWLSWHNLPPVLTLTAFSMVKMVILDLSWSMFSESWDGWSHIKMARNLKVLNLTGCAQLQRTPDLSALVKLEQLILESCGRLVQIDKSIGQLKQLVLLNLRFCRKLHRLPAELVNLEVLKELLIDWTSIREIPGSGGMKKLETLSACKCLSLNNCSSVGNLTSLLRLSLEHVEISELPLEIGGLVKLEYLSLGGCNSLKKIPDKIGNLESLVVLNLSHTHIAELPNSLGNLKNLKTLRMCSSSIKSIPSAIGMLEKLEELDAEKCHCLEGTIPDDIGRLSSLRILKLSDTRICYIPRLPESLLSLHIGTNSMTELPDLSNLINLIELKLEIPQVADFCLGEEDSTFGDMTELVRHPSPWWIGRLCNLESLKLSCDGIRVLHADIGLLSELKRLELVCFNLQFLPRLPSNLLCLLIKSCISLESSIDLSNLKKLSELRIYSSAITGAHGLDGLENLQTLDLQALNALERLPDLSNLKKLDELHLGHCHNLVDIQSIQGLGHLRILELIEIVQLERVPDLSNLKKLTELHLRQCHILTQIQSFEGLENLIMLELVELPLLEGLPDLSDLKKLTKLDVRQCHHLVKIRGRLDSVEDLCIYGCRSLVEMPAPSSFKNLKSLQLCDCEMLQMQQVWVPKPDTVDTEFGSSECLMMRRLGICVCQLGRHFFLPSLPS